MTGFSWCIDIAVAAVHGALKMVPPMYSWQFPRAMIHPRDAIPLFSLAPSLASPFSSSHCPEVKD